MNEIVFDIETQNTFAEVDNDFKKFKISVVSIYSYATDVYQSFTEHELTKLWPILERADRIIGYNSEHFDLPILHNYYLGHLDQIPHLDIMKCVKEALGFRLKLDDLAQATLDGVQKSADGLQAIRWYREGKIDEIKKYCEMDVKITKEIYDFGRANKQLFYKNLKGEEIPFAVNFEPVKNSSDHSMANKINLTLPF
ncbi:MAG: ribonuclease H-like domain-containing protein [Candidatus Magasanikbacteria bacterium]|jgi:DEAD/DEAH box helicase domain-containing protein